MRKKRPNFRVKHPYQNLINSMLLGILLLFTSVFSVMIAKPISLGDYVDAYGGTGTSSNPYLIYNTTDLKNVNKFATRALLANRGIRTFKLMADVDATSLNDVVMDDFYGIFEGNNNSITTSMQLFNIIGKNSEVKDLTITLRENDTIFDPASKLSRTIFAQNVLHSNLINEISDIPVDLNVEGYSEVQNNAVFINKFFLGTVKADILSYNETLENDFHTTDEIEEINQELTRLNFYVKKFENSAKILNIDFSVEEIKEENEEEIVSKNVILFKGENGEIAKSDVGVTELEPLNNQYLNIPILAIANYGLIEGIVAQNENNNITLYNYGGLVRFNAPEGRIFETSNGSSTTGSSNSSHSSPRRGISISSSANRPPLT